MTTQSLRGMANHGPMHWRGDRTGGSTPGGDPLDESEAFQKFNVAFAGLLGRTGPLTTAEMQAFTDFILQVTYPPNPIRTLDNSLTTDQQAGRNFYFGPQPSDTFQNCNGCHRLDPTAGFFGSDGFSTFENEPQFMKIPHLRNLYQKVGMFGMPAVPFLNTGDNGPKGPQIRGFGFLHDGSTDSVFRFFHATVFNQSGTNPGGFGNDTQRRQVEAFVLAMDSNLEPIVGQQITLTDTNAATIATRLDLLNAQAPANCDLVVKGTVAGAQRGWYKTSAGFRSDRAAEPTLTDAALRALAATPGQDLTYTGVPPGSGQRIGIDGDSDGFFDADEVAAGSDPADAASTPCGTPASIAKAKTKVSKNLDPAGDEGLTIQGEVAVAGTLDPTTNGFRFQMEDPQGNVIFDRAVPGGAGLWTTNKTGTKWTFNDRDGLVFPGFTKVVVQAGRAPGVYKLKVTAKNDNFQVAAAQVPVQVFVILGNGTGQCARQAFNPSGGATPACTISSGGKTVSCR